VISSHQVADDSEIIIITSNGKIIRMKTDRIRQTVSRSAQGVKLIDLGKADQVADVTLVPPEGEAEIDEEEADE
jgi:DNA gyrase/topoisomerase IV subunit A